MNTIIMSLGVLCWSMFLIGGVLYQWSKTLFSFVALGGLGIISLAAAGVLVGVIG